MQSAIEGYRIRPRSFVLSVAFHGVAVAALTVLPAVYTETAPKRPIYDELIRPQEHKIIWYKYPEPLPDVSPAERIGKSPKPRGRELSKDTIIAMAPKAKSSKEFIWQPVPKIELPKDVPTPNLVSRMRTSFVAPPPRPKEEVRPNNPDAPRAPQINTSPQMPNGDVKHALEATESIVIPKPAKAFVPPPARPGQQARLTLPVQAGEVALPDASVLGSSNSRNPLPAGIGAPSFSRGVAPPSDAPPGMGTAGNGKVDIAAVGLNPANGPVPNGSRGGQFSRAPALGEPSTGEVSGSGLTVPGLAIQAGHSTPPAPPQVMHATLYADKVHGVPVSTLSVPLRPASRTIPYAIDRLFQGRDVYTMVIPIENLPRYSGDWILWFAERRQESGDRPSMRSPIPLRKVEPLEAPLTGARTEFRVQVQVIITRVGKIEGISVLGNLSPGLHQAVIEDIASWDFKPATRDGNPVDVDAVIEIPFSLPPEIARRVPQAK